MRQRDANLTALAAIGPRKKRKVDCAGPGSGAEVPRQAAGEAGEGPGERGPHAVPLPRGVGLPLEFGPHIGSSVGIT